MSKNKIAVIDKKCIACGACAKKCPEKAIKVRDAIAVVSEKKCVGCGKCEKKCPVKAITIEKRPK